jgi:hypothetical protein
MFYKKTLKQAQLEKTNACLWVLSPPFFFFFSFFFFFPCTYGEKAPNMFLVTGYIFLV